jgi:hypothetical protein
MESQEAWRAIFFDLVDGLCRELRAEPVARGHDDDLPLELELHIDGHIVDLGHDWSSAPERVTARVRCGAIPSDRAAAVLKRLLRAQHEADPRAGRSFGLDAVTGELLLVANMELQGLSAAEFLGRLRNVFGTLAALRDGDITPHAEGSLRDVIPETFAA